MNNHAKTIQAAHLKNAKPSNERISIYYKFNSRCYYCGSPLSLIPTMLNYIQLDHIYPKSKGGKNKKSNYVSACSKCNRSKGNRTLEEYRRQCQQQAFYDDNGIKFSENQLKWLGENRREIVFNEYVFYGEKKSVR